jgi:hypothetical protein
MQLCKQGSWSAATFESRSLEGLSPMFGGPGWEVELYSTSFSSSQLGTLCIPQSKWSHAISKSRGCPGGVSWMDKWVESILDSLLLLAPLVPPLNREFSWGCVWNYLLWDSPWAEIWSQALASKPKLCFPGQRRWSWHLAGPWTLQPWSMSSPQRFLAPWTSAQCSLPKGNELTWELLASAVWTPSDSSASKAGFGAICLTGWSHLERTLILSFEYKQSHFYFSFTCNLWLGFFS